MNFTDIAHQAMQHLRPELLLLAGKSLEGAASESGKQLVSWFKDHLPSAPAKAALNDAVAHPADALRLSALELQIKILLNENDSFRRNLSAFLKTLPAPTQIQQTATATGDHNTIVQAGEGNKINIA